jgi:hypothetical protein
MALTGRKKLSAAAFAEHDGFKKRTVTMAQWLHRAEYVSMRVLI